MPSRGRGPVARTAVLGQSGACFVRSKLSTSANRSFTDFYPLSCILQIYFKNQTAAVGQSHPTHLPLPDVLAIVIDSFTSATERHIEVRFLITSARLRAKLTRLLRRSATAWRSTSSWRKAAVHKGWTACAASRSSARKRTATAHSSSGENSRKIKRLAPAG